MPKVFAGRAQKPYTIAMVGDNDAEINLYGEVVSTRPVDWWTGEPLPGNYIALDDFLKDLDELSTKDNITVHINSVGGDLYAGIAIYNRLKGLAGNVTTINDSLAASAGSLIFMAGNTRKVNAGSNLMIHGAAGFLFGYYQTQDLRAAIKQLDAHNKAALNIYAERTGRTVEEIKPLVDRETWLTGQDAVEQGFADEVITDGAQDISMKLSPDKSHLVVNGMSVAACFLGKIPDNIPQMTADEWATVSNKETTTNMQPAPQADINTNQNGGNEQMEINNAEELRTAFPDFVAQIETAARAEGVNAERGRIQGIEAIQNAIGDQSMVNNAKYGEKPLTAEQLAFQAMQAQAAIGATVLNNMVADTKASGVGNVVATPAGEDPKGMSDDEKAVALLAAAIPANMKKKEG